MNLHPVKLIHICFAIFFFLLPGYGGVDPHRLQHTVDFIYIDSSVDESAGGHAALRFGQTIFHYQYHHSNGLFLLAKENWLEFQYSYNNLQNRTISIASLPISNETFQKIKNQFLSRYLLQEKRLSYLKQLKSESLFFRELLSSNRMISIDGLGFFSSTQKNDSIALNLRNSIDVRFGASYITSMQKEIDKRVKEVAKRLHPVQLYSKKLNLYKPSKLVNGNVKSYIELKELQEAIDVISEGRPLDDDTLIYSPVDMALLTKSELQRLQQYRDSIKNSILQLLKSSRSDKGQVLLLQIARFHVISKSIKLGRLVTLDPFSEESELHKVNGLQFSIIAVPHRSENTSDNIDSEDSVFPLDQRFYFEQIRIELLQDLANVKHHFFSIKDNENISYNQLEASLGRLNEWNNIQENGGILRVEGGVLLPNRSERAVISFQYNNKALSQNVDLARENEKVFTKLLHELYNYNLITQNCVTELFETIYSCFATTEQAKENLGGYLVLNRNISFIPFSSFNQVKQQFRKASIEEYPSYMKVQKNKLYKQQGFWSLMKESNTLTSTIYFPWEEDSIFLFFTDDVLFTRPIFGVGNTVFAMANMLGGFVWSPIDSGRMLKRSVRGLIFSLPELAFFNIRKGTFPATALEN